MKEHRVFPVNSFIVHKRADGDWTVAEYVTNEGCIMEIYAGHDYFHLLCSEIANAVGAGIYNIEYQTNEEFDEAWG